MNNAHAFCVQSPSILNITYMVTALDECGCGILLAVASYTMVAPNTHFNIKLWPNTLQASSNSTWQQCPCFLHPKLVEFGRYKA